MARLNALIMPSAVAPSPATPFQALVDPKVRLAQTIKAITYWVKLAEKNDFRVLVVDNTSFANQIMDSLNKQVSSSPKLNVIDIPLISELDIKRGKGAGETSSLIAGLNYLNLPEDSIVGKVNARYITTNGLFLVNELDESFDFAAWPRPYLDSVDTTFFVGKAGFLAQAFSYVYKETDDLKERFVENLYADFSIRNKDCSYVRFAYSPATKGQHGTTGSKASALNELRMVSNLVRLRKKVRQVLYFLKPKYQRGLK